MIADQISVRPTPPADRRTVEVRDLADCLAALAAAEQSGYSVQLISAPSTAFAAGGAYFRAIIRATIAAYPAFDGRAILDCGDDAGVALANLKAGSRFVLLRGDAQTVAKVAAIAAVLGAELLTKM